MLSMETQRRAEEGMGRKKPGKKSEAELELIRKSVDQLEWELRGVIERLRSDGVARAFHVPAQWVNAFDGKKVKSDDRE